MINVTKTYLPDFDTYQQRLQQLWESGWITNNGSYVQELEKKLADYFQVKHCLLVANGTLALQLALKLFNITGEVITTPYSYVATTNAILWEKATPVYADINPTTGCIDPKNIEAEITSKTQAILPVHVYGLPCNIEEIKQIANKYNLKIIYDAAHTFGVGYKNKPLVNYGDISTLSFHATKLFHTIEGGAIITNNDEHAEKLKLLRAFGHINDNYIGEGINAKLSEMHAAMGLCIFDDMNKIIAKRKRDFLFYQQQLNNIKGISFFEIPPHTQYNYSYFPVLFRSEKEMLAVKTKLEHNGYGSRRYFYPSLNTLPQVTYQPCPISEKIAKRVLCLPHFYENTNEIITDICRIIKQELS